MQRAKRAEIAPRANRLRSPSPPDGAWEGKVVGTIALAIFQKIAVDLRPFSVNPRTEVGRWRPVCDIDRIHTSREVTPQRNPEGGENDSSAVECTVPRTVVVSDIFKFVNRTFACAPWKFTEVGVSTIHPPAKLLVSVVCRVTIWITSKYVSWFCCSAAMPAVNDPPFRIRVTARVWPTATRDSVPYFCWHQLRIGIVPSKRTRGISVHNVPESIPRACQNSTETRVAHEER